MSAWRIGIVVALLLLCLPALDVGADDTKKHHRVLGKIDFSYSYVETLARAQKDGRPIFAYFTFEA